MAECASHRLTGPKAHIENDPDYGRAWVGQRAYRPLWEAGAEPSRKESGSDVASASFRVLRRGPSVHPGGFSKEILRKEVIQPQVPLRLPCYDLVPITGFIFGACLAAPTTSDAPRFGGLTGGVYKAQEHIHRGMLIRDY